MVDEQIEECLELLYRYEEIYSRGVKTLEVAKELSISPAAATDMLRKLANMGLVVHTPYRGAKLTDKGRELALKIIRKHRLSERLLTDILKADWSSVHEEACKIEHAISDRVEALIDEKLNKPATCPHGAPIPREGPVKQGALTLSSLEGEGVITRILKEDEEILKFFSKTGLKPGTPVKVVEKGPYGDPIVVNIDGKEKTISRVLAEYVVVKKAKRLTELKEGEKGVIVTIVNTDDISRRLMDMGLTPDTKIQVIRKAPFGGPIEVLVRGSKIAIGREIANRVFVEA